MANFTQSEQFLSFGSWQNVEDSLHIDLKRTKWHAVRLLDSLPCKLRCFGDTDFTGHWDVRPTAKGTQKSLAGFRSRSAGHMLCYLLYF